MSEEIQTVTYASSGSVRGTPVQQLNLKFQPDMVVFKQMTFVTNPIANGTMYYLWCSLVNDYIGVFHYMDGFIAIEPRTTFSIYSWPQDVTFRVDYNVPGSPQPSGVWGDLSVTLEFSRGKKAEYFISQD